MEARNGQKERGDQPRPPPGNLPSQQIDGPEGGCSEKCGRQPYGEFTDAKKKGPKLQKQKVEGLIRNGACKIEHILGHGNTIGLIIPELFSPQMKQPKSSPQNNDQKKNELSPPH
jgi:hypothetical protein